MSVLVICMDSYYGNRDCMVGDSEVSLLVVYFGSSALPICQFLSPNGTYSIVSQRLRILVGSSLPAFLGLWVFWKFLSFCLEHIWSLD